MVSRKLAYLALAYLPTPPMKVVSKLVKMDFSVGKIERKDEYLIIHSDPDKSTVPTKVRMSAEDIVAFMRAGLSWPVIKYMLLLPFNYRKWRSAPAATAEKPKRTHSDQSGWG